MGEVGEDLVDLLFVFGISEKERKRYEEEGEEKVNKILAAIMEWYEVFCHIRFSEVIVPLE